MDPATLTALVSTISSLADTAIESTTQVWIKGVIEPQAAAAAYYRERLNAARNTINQQDGTQVGRYLLFASIGILALIIILKVILKNEK
jgi:hypothetical protein